jgi:Purine catabolism regulatory protein-like family/PucR C-terminal helix-turn-helix domain/GGDEF-like domain
MLPTLADVLSLPAVRRGEPVLRAGADRLDRQVRWVHVSEVSDIASLLEGGELILTTGIALPESAGALGRYVHELHDVGVSALAVELGRRYHGALPEELVAAATQVDLPLIELRRVTPFVAVTQAVHTLILDARLQEGLERQTHRTLLTALAFSAGLPPHLGARSRALGVPLERRMLTGVVVRPAAAGEAVDGLPALLRDVASTAGTSLQALGTPALVGLLDDHRVALLLSQERSAVPEDVLRVLSDRLHALGDRHPQVPMVVGTGSTVTGADRAPATVREAMQVADTAAGLPTRRTYYRPPDLRLRSLAYALREDPVIRDYVERELGVLLAQDAAHGTSLYEFVAAFCRCGGNKTLAARELFMSRAALYDRVAKVERLLDIDLGDPEVVLALHFAVLARETMRRPDLAVLDGG